MWIEEVGTNFEITFHYSKEIYNAVKRLPDSWWDQAIRRWKVPKRYRDKVEAFYHRYYIKSLAAAPEKIGVVPDMLPYEGEINMKRTPFNFQLSGIKYMVDHKGVLVGDQPGLGKTTEAIGANVVTGDFPTLVICPATLKYNWKKEWMDVAGERAIILSDKIEKTWHRYVQTGLAKVVIVNYESLRKYFVSHINKPEGEELRLKHIILNPHIDMFKTIIVDESHRCKDPKAVQSKITAGVCFNKPNVYALSGTPVINKTADLIAQLHIIGRMKDFGGDKYFTERYCKTDKYLKELSYRLNSTCFFQRRKADVLKDLPDKIRQIMLCDITTRREYNEALGNLERYLKDYKSKSDPQVRKSMAGAAMVLVNVCREISARGKLNEVYEYIDNLNAVGEKVVIFAHQRIITRTLKAKYGNAVAITGEESLEERRAAEETFQTDPNCKLCICSIKAAGVGLTLTAAQNLGAVEFPWHAADADQMEDRLHRITQEGSVTATYFLGVNTVDQRMYEIIESKRALAGTITGNKDTTEQEIIDLLSESLFSKNSEEVFEATL